MHLGGGVLLQAPSLACSGTPQITESGPITKDPSGLMFRCACLMWWTTTSLKLRYALNSSDGIALARSSLGKECTMSRTSWWLIGALLLGTGIAVYLIFFCPVECH